MSDKQKYLYRFPKERLTKLIKLSVLVLGSFLATVCMGFYSVYTPWGDDFGWILYCDHRFANVASWFTRGMADYFLNYSGASSTTPFFRPLTASFYYLASLGHSWAGYKSQLALNYLLLLFVFWTYSKFLRRYTPLPTPARWLVGACFVVSPVWSGAYFIPASRVHLLECACVLVATLALPAPEETARLKGVVLAGCVSAGAIFAHEVAVVAPLVVALTHYLTSYPADLRRKVAREALLIVAISYGVYFPVRLAFFHLPVENAYPLMSLTALGLATNCVSTILRLFLPFETYINTAVFLGRPLRIHTPLFMGRTVGRIGTPAAWTMLFITLLAYILLAAKLMRKSRYSRELRMLATCAAVASAPVVLHPIARQMCIILVYSLPLLYLALEPLTFRDLKQLRLAQASTVILVCALSIYVIFGLRAFLEMRTHALTMVRRAHSMERTLESAMVGGGNEIYLINDLVGQFGNRAMLQLKAREKGVTLINPTSVNQLYVSDQELPPPAGGTPGVLVECRGDVLSIQIELAAGRAFWFPNFDPQVMVRGESSGRYEFPDMRPTERSRGFLRKATEMVDYGSTLIFTSPTKCSQTVVVGFPGKGVLESRFFSWAPSREMVGGERR